MNTVVSQDVLEKIFDQVVREVTEKVAGIRFYQGDAPPIKQCYTVYAAYERGYNSTLSLCAEASVFTRLTQNIMQDEKVTAQDIEDFTKEYFNVLCGNIASKMFQVTKVASRFEIPSFCYGRYQPNDLHSQFVIDYFSDRNEGVQLIHHTPLDIKTVK